MSKEAKEKYAKLINKQYHRLIYKIAYQILEDTNRIEDVKQEVLIRCTDKVEKLQTMNDRQLTAYICVVVKNVSLNELQRKNRQDTHETLVADFEDARLSLEHDSFKAFGEKFGLSDYLTDILDKMKPIDKDIFLLRYFVGLSNEEVARAVGISEDGVKKRIQRAKIRVMNAMIDEEGEGNDGK